MLRSRTRGGGLITIFTRFASATRVGGSTRLAFPTMTRSKASRCSFMAGRCESQMLHKGHPHDAGGSIRLPSSANGVVGLKPTYGRVSRFGVLPLAQSLDHVGPMARRVADVAIMFDAIAGVDPRDPTSLRESAPNSYRDIGQGIEGLRIGLDREYAFAGVDRGQVASIEEALKVRHSMAPWRRFKRPWTRSRRLVPPTQGSI